MITQVLQQLTTQRDKSLARLIELLAIPSVSTDPARAPDCRKAAQFLADELTGCGLTATLHNTPGHPIVLAHSPNVPGARHVLFYGHYDVQPTDPIELWQIPPFEPTIRDGRIYARGAADDKGQVWCFISALRAWKAIGATPPINLTVLLEGEEECGSSNLDPFIFAHRTELACDVALVSDTGMWGDGIPAITYGLRGLLYFDLKLHGPTRDLHSGVYGGVVANPATELTKVLGQLFDSNLRLTIPGFYDDVLPTAQIEKERWAKLPFDEDAAAREIGVPTFVGELGYSFMERRTTRPSCDINGLYGGYMGHGAKTVIPAFAGAKVSFRLANDQDPDKIGPAFKKWLEDRTPVGCRWEITEFGRAKPVAVSVDSPYLKAAARAVAIGCGQPPVLIREGATIPVVSTFKTVLGVDTLLVGFGLHDDCIHSPNEKFDLRCFDWGCRSHVALLGELGGAV